MALSDLETIFGDRRGGEGGVSCGHGILQFRGGLKVGNVVERLVAAHDSGLGVLEEAAMTYFQENARAFQAYFVRVVPCCFCLLRF